MMLRSSIGRSSMPTRACRETAGTGLRLRAFSCFRHASFRLERRLQRETTGGEQRFAIRPHREFRKPSDLMCQSLGSPPSRSSRHDLGNETNSPRFLRIHRSPGKHQFHRARFSYQARKTHRRTITHRHTEATAKHTEYSRRVGNSDITIKREAQSTGNRVTFHCGNQRFLEWTTQQTIQMPGPSLVDHPG